MKVKIAPSWSKRSFSHNCATVSAAFLGPTSPELDELAMFLDAHRVRDIKSDEHPNLAAQDAVKKDVCEDYVSVLMILGCV